MARYAVINEKNIVVNVVEWEGKPWSPPKGCYTIQSDKADIGDAYNKTTNEFTKPIRVVND